MLEKILVLLCITSFSFDTFVVIVAPDNLSLPPVKFSCNHLQGWLLSTSSGSWIQMKQCEPQPQVLLALVVEYEFPAQNLIFAFKVSSLQYNEKYGTVWFFMVIITVTLFSSISRDATKWTAAGNTQTQGRTSPDNRGSSKYCACNFSYTKFARSRTPDTSLLCKFIRTCFKTRNSEWRHVQTVLCKRQRSNIREFLITSTVEWKKMLDTLLHYYFPKTAGIA